MKTTKRQRLAMLERRLKFHKQAWADWQARGLTLPDDETLERLSQPDAVASVGGRLVPIDSDPKEEPR